METQSVGFVLPHWIYWGWLAVMPLVVIAIAKAKGVLPPVQYAPRSGGFEKLLDWISDRTGTFVALWSVNAVVIYTYEVTARYLFNMPTIWVHEASFLMFGMQYMLAGAYGLLYGAHVRVDVLYSKLSARHQAAMSVFTSVFFFIFVLAMLGTSWTFFRGSIEIDERSIETWQVHFWPVKAMMLLGTVLILLAGISQLIKDIRTFELTLREGGVA